MKKIKIKSQKRIDRKKRRREQTVREKKAGEKRRKLIFQTICLVIAIPLLAAAVYLLLKNLTTKKPKVYVQLFDPSDGSYRHTNVDRINQVLNEDGKAVIKVTVIAKQDYYRSLNQVTEPMDYIKLSFLDTRHKPVKTVFIKLEVDEAGKYWTGSRIMKLSGDEKSLQIAEFVRVVHTSKDKTAQKFPVLCQIR